MTPASWQQQWLRSTSRQIHEPRVWRGVETQYASATTCLVNTLQEHDVLERMIEDSKPPLPASAAGQHDLLVTPFRYMPQHCSRFRRVGLHGIWYGARALKAACAEVAYWRMRFIRDSVGLAGQKIVSSHTFFAATVDGIGIDLMHPPWSDSREIWISDDYAQTQRLAEAAQAQGIELIQYESARAAGATCFAVFTSGALREPRGGLDKTRQAWSCTATSDHVMMVCESDRSERFEFDLGSSSSIY